jgi:hypothetical protein
MPLAGIESLRRLRLGSDIGAMAAPGNAFRTTIFQRLSQQMGYTGLANDADVACRHSAGMRLSR